MVDVKLGDWMALFGILAHDSVAVAFRLEPGLRLGRVVK